MEEIGHDCEVTIRRELVGDELRVYEGVADDISED